MLFRSGIVSVAPTGSATGNAAGTATISATAASLSGFATVTVTPAVEVALNIVPGTLSILLGGSRQLQAIETMSDGSTQNVTKTVMWGLSPAGIANVSARGLVTAQQVGSTTIFAQDSSLTASASLTVTPLALVNHYDRANAEASGIDGTLRLVNPGVVPGDLCAMVYVFDQSQELTECCGCSISDGGIRTMSLLLDLTANPLTGKKSPAGIIKVVPSDNGQNPQCDPRVLNPQGALAGWETNVQPIPDGTFQVTETGFESASLDRKSVV